MEEKDRPKDPPPYMSCFFTNIDRDIITMITCILGFTTNESMDEMKLASMSISTLGQPPGAKFDYATFVADKMHDQFMILEHERVFKYSSALYHLFLYYKLINSLSLSKSLILKGILGLLFFGPQFSTILALLLILTQISLTYFYIQ